MGGEDRKRIEEIHSYIFGSIACLLYNDMVDIVILQIKIFDIHLMSSFSIVRSMISYYCFKSNFLCLFNIQGFYIWYHCVSIHNI